MSKNLKQGMAVVTASMLATLSLSALAAPTPDSFTPPLSSATSWFDAGKLAVADARKLQKNIRRAKNVILFVGDGMGVSTVTATRILQGQQPGIIGTGNGATESSGEENLLSFEKFPYLAHSKTYSVNQQTPDSAPTMTAMVTGVKTNGDELSVNQTMTHGSTVADCNRTDLAANSLPTILERAEDAGLSTGLVSTARITHATPAANYAHTTNRDWEADSNQPAAGCVIPDIARQLIEFKHGDGIDVVFGGGRTYFLPNTVKDPEYPTVSGKRKDGRNLTDDWVKAHSGATFITDTAGFSQINPASASHVLGLFEPSHMQYEADRNTTPVGEPSLAALTDKSIRILKNNKKGFYLHVEAGRIDHGHHAGNAYRALTDAIALSDAVKQAQATLAELKLDKDTLIVVTADHSHVFTIAGYPQRGNNILGKVIAFDNPQAGYVQAVDKAPYTTLSYANGGGYAVGADGDVAYPTNTGRTVNMTTIDTTDKNFHQQALVPTGTGGSETHAGEDVAIYATGPYAHLFHGTQENLVIYHVMAAALGFK